MTRGELGSNLSDLLFYAPNVGLNDEQKRLIVTSCNQALQEMIVRGGRYFYTQFEGVLVRAPVTVTFDATEGSKTIANFTTWSSWMSGCTMKVGDYYYRLDSSTTLLQEYFGDTGTSIAGTVYQDSFDMPAQTVNVLGPVIVDSRGRLRHVQNEADTLHLRDQGLNYYQHDYSEHRLYPSNAGFQQNTPFAYWITNEITADDSTDDALDLIRLKIAPFPSKKHQLQFWRQYVPHIFTQAELVDGGSGSTDAVPVPRGFTESVLLPIARQRLAYILPTSSNLTTLPTSSAGITEETLDQFYREYVDALKILDRLAAQVGQPNSLTVSYR